MINKIKPGFFFGVFMSVIFIAESFFSAHAFTTREIVTIILTDILTGAIGGFVFGFLINKFMASKFVKNSTQININEDEKIIFETPANHFKRVE
ncbi:MAG: hypothetical protein ACRDE8_06280, partial [Ginsengibacter sp.]